VYKFLKSHSLPHKIIFSTGLNLAQQFVIAVSGIIVARWVGPSVLGILAYLGAYVGLFVALADFGMGTAHVKRISEGQNLGQCMGTMWFLKSFFILFTIIVIFATKKIIGQPLLESKETQWVFYIVIGTFLFNQLAQVPWATFVAYQDIFHKDIPPTFIQAGMSLIRLLVAILGWGVIGLACVDLCSSILILIVYLYILNNLPIQWPSLEFVKNYLRYGIPVFFCAIFTGLSDKIDRVLLQSFGGITAVGEYSVGMRLGSIFQFFSQTVGTLLFPSLSRAYARKEYVEAFNLCSRAEHYMALVLFPALLLITAISRPLIFLLLGKKFPDTGPVFVFGTMTMIFLALIQPFRQLFGSAEKMTAMVILNMSFLFIQIISLFMFLKFFHPSAFFLAGSAPRAALASAISALIGAVLWRVAAIHLLRAKLNHRIWVHVSFAMVIFGITYMFTYSGNVQNLGSSCIVGLGASLLHILLLWLVKVFNKEDLVFFKQLIVFSYQR